MSILPRALPGRLALSLGFLLLIVLGFGFVSPGCASEFEVPASQDVASVTSPEESRRKAETSKPSTTELNRLKMAINVIWVVIAAFLVMALKAGFSLFETGLIRAKNVAHTMSMNFAIYAVSVLGFWAVGFALMFGGHGPSASLGISQTLDSMGSIHLFGLRWDLIGFSGFFLNGSSNEVSVLSLFVLQAMFVDTAATIPTGLWPSDSSFRRVWLMGCSRRC